MFLKVTSVFNLGLLGIVDGYVNESRASTFSRNILSRVIIQLQTGLELIAMTTRELQLKTVCHILDIPS
jgi:hypothetical protein